MSAARVAVGTVELHLPDVGSLKGKRHVLKGLKDKLRQRFEISVAEVDHHEAWQRATLAVACVSGDSRHANEVIRHAGMKTPFRVLIPGVCIVLLGRFLLFGVARVVR